MRRTLVLVLAVSLTACGGGSSPEDAGGGDDAALDTDGGGGATVCEADAECSDGAFCTGAELCLPSDASADEDGCVAGAPPCSGTDVCNEELQECIPESCTAIDADSDGHRSVECGGDDCDDADANRFPGNVEVCDGDGRDEDCNADTFGFLDADGDGAASASCCNGINCGTDCNDADSTVNPRAGDGPPLSCDGVDNDCSGTADEGCPCVEGETNPCGSPAQLSSIGLCRPGTQVCSGGMLTEECIGGVSPQAEVCDTQDNDCDGDIDNGVLRTYVTDADDDGFGAVGGVTVEACSPPDGFATSDTDCDDTARSVNPLAAEVCNGTDDNCNSETDEGVLTAFFRDSDGDGFGNSLDSTEACARPAGYVTNGIDCDDTSRNVNPPAFEACDGIDNNCDTDIDDGCSCTDGDTQPCGAADGTGGILTVGACEAGTQRCAGGVWGACTGATEPVSETCNGIDDNCAGGVDEGVTSVFHLDDDGDGFGDSSMPIDACAAPTGYVVSASDCDDSAASINPAATEACDGEDNNCDSSVDDGCSCTDGLTRACGTDAPGGGFLTTGECEEGTQRCLGGAWGACTGAVAPRAEICNTLDDDCDGTPDNGVQNTYYVDGDGDGFGLLTMTVAACAPPTGHVGNGLDCDDGAAAISPSAVESCDGVDNDCDGATDPGCTCLDGQTQACGQPDGTGGIETDGECVAGSQLCVGGAWTGCAGAVLPRTETCNGLDDNCDGATDETLEVDCWADPDDDGWSITGAAMQTFCPVAGRAAEGGCPIFWTFRPPGTDDCADDDPNRFPGQTETCNGIDDDCDGTTDEDTLAECAVTGGYGACLSGGCAVVACAPGFGDCNGDRMDGCEVDITADTAHCGGCQRSCGGGECSERLCEIPTSLGFGGSHGCVGFPSGRAACWGSNFAGRLGDGTSANRSFPAPVSNMTDAASVAVGTSSCALLNDGTAACWGLNGDGQLGDGTTTQRTTPVPVGGLSNIDLLSVGGRHTCALLDDNTVRCWGDNAYGQVGDNGMPTDRPSPVTVALSGVSHLHAGVWHHCAVSSGRVWCWGRNDSLQTGVNDPAAQPIPRQVSIITNATQVVGGFNHSCAIRGAGTVSCWGRGFNGQLGDGNFTSGHVPVDVSGITDAVQLAAGWDHSCARHADGTVSCWGEGGDGQIGDGMMNDHGTPSAVPGLTDVISIDAGASSTCALRSNGDVYCWGLNHVGQLGDGTISTRLSPRKIPTLGGTFEIDSSSDHTCARRSTGEVLCWGSGLQGAIGDGDSNDETTATPINSDPDYVQISTGIRELSISSPHSCGLRSDGSVACWGSNSWGQLGTGSTGGSSASPVDVVSLSNVDQVNAGAIESCAVITDGTVRCWGYGYGGTATTVPGLTEAVRVAVGLTFRCALRRDGSVWCWGFNSTGQLGRTDSSFGPLPVDNLAGAIGLTAGHSHACALRADGTVACWGSNSSGQVGNGSAAPAFEATSVVGLTQVLEVEAGEFSNCARRVTGELYCWGANESGQLGDGTMTNRPAPVNMPGIGFVVDPAPGGHHSCARLSSGEVGCWGANGNGELGDGTMTPSPIYVPVLGL